MAEFRYQGVTVSGKPFQGTVYAPTMVDARRKIDEIARDHGLQIRSVHKRVFFSYRVRKADNQKVLHGEIAAFTPDEVRSSLESMGYRVLSVRRKYFQFRMPVPEKDIVMFIRLCADLLKEKFAYDEILTLLAHDIENRTLRETVLEIHKDLRMGKEGHQVYLKHAGIFGKFTAHMLSIASTSGNMVEIYENTAKFLDRTAEFKRNIRRVLFMPTIVLISSIGAIIFYIGYIFPQIAGLLLKYKIDVPPMTAKTLVMSNFLQNHYLWVALSFITPIVLTISFFRTGKGRILWAKMILNIPIVGKLFYRSSIEVFSRVFHALYSGSGENIEAIKIAAEACRNAYLEKLIKEKVIPMMIRDGKSLSDALEIAKVFPRNAIYTIKSGEETGTLKDATLRLANFYERETHHKMNRVVDLINLVISIFVSAIIIGITLLSTEIGFVSPPTTNFLH
ncbi:MAG: type II secretion system F family protein [Calditrichaeota bacterium]|nr:MAG: type II secretion system F family protein [Calditrichota bacterium]